MSLTDDTIRHDHAHLERVSARRFRIVRKELCEGRVVKVELNKGPLRRKEANAVKASYTWPNGR